MTTPATEAENKLLIAIAEFIYGCRLVPGDEGNPELAKQTEELNTALGIAIGEILDPNDNGRLLQAIREFVKTQK
jgi:hypothetical protein